jgi:hypothetical protein
MRTRKNLTPKPLPPVARQFLPSPPPPGNSYLSAASLLLLVLPARVLRVAGAAQTSKVLPFVVLPVAVDMVHEITRGSPAHHADGFLNPDDCAETFPPR